MLNAIFHRGSYLLLPDDLPTHEAFMADLHSRELPATYALVPLLENNRVRCFTVFKGFCLAPYFLSGYRDEPANVVIQDPNEVYPVQIERMTQEEYNARLRTVVESACEGCTNHKPLSPKVQSLNSYFENISLNGVCPFRYEGKPAPRSFQQNIMWLGVGFMRSRYAEKTAEEIRAKLKEYLYLVYDSAEKTVQPDGTTLLTVTPKKKELLPPYLTLAIGHYISSLTNTYRIQPVVQPALSPEAILAFATPERRETFRKECKKYGVSIAELPWDGQDDGHILRMLWEQNKHSILYPLWEGPGRAILLLMDTPEALKTLRFHTPMLEAHHAAITVHGQYHSRRYAVNFDMPYETLD